MSARDYDAERYNRRTRAIKDQAEALHRIAAALEVQALAAAASTSASTSDGTGRAWTTAKAKELMGALGRKAGLL